MLFSPDLVIVGTLFIVLPSSASGITIKKRLTRAGIRFADKSRAIRSYLFKIIAASLAK